MSEQLKDGTGKGFLVRVDKDHHMETASVTETEQHHVSEEDQLAFAANTSDTANTLTITATGGPILFIRNDSADEIMTVADIIISVNTAGLIVRILRNQTLGTIGNNNTHTSSNSNFGSSKTADATVFNWDEVGDGITGLSGGAVYSVFTLPVGLTRLHINGEIILTQNDNIVIEIIGAGEASVFAAFFFEEAD